MIIIAVDTLAAGHLQTYGYGRDTMPQTEQFFSRGTIFENAYSGAPWTLPSFASLYFSNVPSQVTFKDLARNGKPSFVSAARDAGSAIYGVLLPNTVFVTDAVNSPFKEAEIEYGGTDTFSKAGGAVRRLSEQSKRTGNPFLLMVHTFDAHDPYSPVPPYDTVFGTSDQNKTVTMQDILHANLAATPTTETLHDYILRYDQQLRRLDDKLGRFLESIPESTLDDTVVILLSDHGEAFWEHGHFWHGLSLHKEEMHVPLMVRAPGAGARRVSEPVSLLDLGPTVLSLMDIPSPDTFAGDDISILLKGENLGKRLLRYENGYPFFLHTITPDIVPPSSLSAVDAWDTNLPVIEKSSEGARWGDLVYIRAVRVPSKRFMFDLSSDPTEKENLLSTTVAETRAPLVEQFKEMLRAEGLF
ncbi:MAG: arylsulfatase A family protein [Parcubacteria group bacterium Athens0416_74]|nr:MAG: arylsulfatase A family protein [Parcubacteria group bacterium Athens0416_74]